MVCSLGTLIRTCRSNKPCPKCQFENGKFKLRSLSRSNNVSNPFLNSNPFMKKEIPAKGGVCIRITFKYRPINLCWESGTSGRLWIAYEVFYSVKVYTAVYCKNVGNDSTYHRCALSLSTMVWKVSNILCSYGNNVQARLLLQFLVNMYFFFASHQRFDRTKLETCWYIIFR